jgi:2-octaprenyl-6-methoxyphenol hydroxylase
LALADAGWRVTLVDPLDRGQLLQSSRGYAFTHSSQRLLIRLGLWAELRAVMVPFTNLVLADLAIARQVSFGSADLAGRRSAPVSNHDGSPDAAVGWIASHRPLMTVLHDRLAANPAVALRLGTTAATAATASTATATASTATAGEQEPSWDLLVAADGALSPSREALGIGVWQHSYRQNCLTTQVELRGCGEHQAWELFRPEGPFAVLPLGGRRFQLVWSAPQARCRQLESLPDVSFLDALAGALPAHLQPDALVEQPRAFPVQLLLARRLHRGKAILLGESGHRCHPVGGQGLNLCWRDVAVLHRLALRAAAGQLPVQRLPAAYGSRRWPDLLLTLAATDLLVRLFSNRQPLLLPLRQLALLSLARFALLRRLSLALMGDGFS